MKWLNDLDLEERLVNHKGLLVVAFFGHESLPCKHFAPEYRAVAESMKGDVEFFRIDAVENPFIADVHGVEFVPVTIVFREGDQVACYEGPYNREALKKRISDLMAPKKKGA
jgi:thioredoxin 1